MSAARFLFAIACLATAADALVVGGRGVSSVRQAATPLAPFTVMKSQEDKEFEEWARKKKIASGVDPDEDFAAGREVESNIYVVGGAVAPPRRPPAHLLPAPPTRIRCAALCSPAALKLCAACPSRRRPHRGARAHDRWHLGLQRGLFDAAVSAVCVSRGIDLISKF